MPGRLRTASSPSSTVMSCAPYEAGSFFVSFFAKRSLPSGFTHREAPARRGGKRVGALETSASEH